MSVSWSSRWTNLRRANGVEGASDSSTSERAGAPRAPYHSRWKTGVSARQSAFEGGARHEELGGLLVVPVGRSPCIWRQPTRRGRPRRRVRDGGRCSDLDRAQRDRWKTRNRCRRDGRAGRALRSSPTPGDGARLRPRRRNRIGLDDEAPKTFRAGEAWTEHVGALHRVTQNNSEATAKILAVLVHDKNAALQLPAE